MRWLVTGGNQGLGEQIIREISQHGEVESVSRSQGYDIKDHASRKSIAEMSLDFDVFVNNAFDGPPHKPWADFGQTKLMYQVFELWRAQNKKGYVFNVGSYATQTQVEHYLEFEFYRASKMALDHASYRATDAFLKNEVLFRTTLLRPGRLDTEKSRSKKNWTGNGHSLESLVSLMRLCLSLPGNTCVRDINLNVNLHW